MDTGAWRGAFSSQFMRIAMVAACPFPWPRGTPIRIHRMAEALGRRGHDVHVVTYHLGGQAPTPHMTVHRINGPSWYRRTAPGPSFAKLALLDPLLTSKLRRLLKAHPFDVIHAHHYEGLLAALFARARRKPPVVFDSHTLLETELPHYGSSLAATLRRRTGTVARSRSPATRRACHRRLRRHALAPGIRGTSASWQDYGGVQWRRGRSLPIGSSWFIERQYADVCRQSSAISAHRPVARILCQGPAWQPGRTAARADCRRFQAVHRACASASASTIAWKYGTSTTNDCPRS